jgi:glycosyltransferase involved in cell wall biosynthesis
VSKYRCLFKNKESLDISVILPAYNSETTIQLAISSVLKDLPKSASELIVIDDGSTDSTWTIIESFQDKRLIKFRRNNSGLTATLNFGIFHSRGKYLARMDSDDYCCSGRFKNQIRFLELNPEYGLVGGNYIEYNILSQDFKMKILPNHYSELLKILRTIGTPFHHSTVMFRREVVSNLGNYNINFLSGQDFEFWNRMASQYKIGSIDNVLCVVCVNNSQSIVGKRKIMDSLKLHFNVFSKYHGTIRSIYLSITAVKPFRTLIKKTIPPKIQIMVRNSRKAEISNTYSSIIGEFSRNKFHRQTE